MTAPLSIDKLFAQLMAGLADHKQQSFNALAEYGLDLPLVDNVKDTHSSAKCSSTPAISTLSSNTSTHVWSPILAQNLNTTDASKNNLHFPTKVPFPLEVDWQLPFVDFGVSAPSNSVSDSDSDHSDCTSKRGFQEISGDNSDDTEYEADRPSKKMRYQCNQCLKYFTRPSSLTTHMYTHTGEKPHECTFPGCSKRFSVLSNLRRHTRLHLDPQPRNIRRKQQAFHHYFLDGSYPMFPMPPLDLPHLLAMQIHEQMLANGDLSGTLQIHPPFIPGIPLLSPHAKLPGLQPIDIVSAASLTSMPIAPLQTPMADNSNLVAGGLSELGLGFGQDVPTAVPRRFSAPPMPAPTPNSWLASSLNNSVGGYSPSANNCNLFL
ncbi:hypothetical protein IW147_001030 [Coemansia sp. RSA 720]|nr:hypothetical protein IW147_001030 [Coemansia sp. RSA 720]